MKAWPVILLFLALTLNLGCHRKSDETLLYTRARTFYNNADSLVKQGQMVEGCSELLQSLKLMDQLTGKNRIIAKPKNEEYEHFTALIYTRLATYFYQYDAWSAALEVLEEANKSYEAENNLTGIADNLELMGDIMIAQTNRPTAMRYYIASDSIHESLPNKDGCESFSMLIHRAIKLFDEGSSDSAYLMLSHGLENTDDINLKRKINYALGHFYSDDQQLDSALTCYQNSYPLLPRQTIYALCRIIQLSNQLGDIENAANYGDTMAAFYLNNRMPIAEKNKLITQYEEYKADARERHNKDSITFITVVVILLIGVVLIDNFLLERVHRRHKKYRAQNEHINRQLMNQMEQVQAESKNKEQKINDLEGKLKRIVSKPDIQSMPFEKKLETLYAMPICKRVRTVKEANVKAFTAYPELALSANQLNSLINAIDAVFPKFSIRIIEMYPRLKHADVVYCCLYILDITEVQAAALTGKTYQAVWTRSLKLHEIFNNKSSLQFVLHDILKNW